MVENSINNNSPPFEGAEKLLEVWFAPSASYGEIKKNETFEKCGLRAVPTAIWEEMLDIVKCKILSSIRGKEIDAYLLSESSLFVWPHKLILKTCGRTLNLLGLPRILEIATNHAGLNNVYQLFYSRKSFMFPEEQIGPHRDWTAEVQFLDDLFRSNGGGSAYTIGKVNGDHWLLYLTGPGTKEGSDGSSPIPLPALDCTIEILMSDLAPCAREPFFPTGPGEAPAAGSTSPQKAAQQLSTSTGLASLFPPHITTLDAYTFDPCGYSSNSLVQCDVFPSSPLTRLTGDGHATPMHSEGYYTVHVTPEEGYSYASFECNIALPTSSSDEDSTAAAGRVPDLCTLVKRVVQIFQPGRLTLTVFMSSSSYQDAGGDTEIESAQKAFLSGLRSVQFGGKQEVARYKRTDKINYEFESYNLGFASFERKSNI